jgi:integrase/recombinase XerD
MDNENKKTENQENPKPKESGEENLALIPIEDPETKVTGPIRIYTDPENKLYDHVDLFIDLLWKMVARGERTKDTFYTYRNGLKQFYEWGKTKGNPPVTPEVIRWFKEHLIGRGLKPATVNAYLVALRVFFEYYAERRFIAYNPVKLVKGMKRKSGVHSKSPLTVEEIHRVLSFIRPPDPSLPDRIKELRNYAMIYLMVKTGLREVEIIRARVEDIQTYQGEKVLFVQGKGRHDKTELVVLVPEVYNSLMDYLNGRGFSKPEDPLFAKLILPTKTQSIRPRTLTTRSIQRVVTEYLYRAGIKTKDNPRPEITAHSLRHTTANLALDGGAPIVQVQEMMRHSKIETTMVYVKQWNRVKKAAEYHIKQV